jgi:hypothetical protein
MAGPYLLAAVFCDRILREIDGVSTLTRVINQITVRPQGVGETPTGEPLAVEVPLNLYVRIARGDSAGTHDLGVGTIPPNGAETSLQQTKIDFGEGSGAEIGLTITLQTNQSGQYWFPIYIDGQEVTRSPLVLQIDTEPPPPPPAEDLAIDPT